MESAGLGESRRFHDQLQRVLVVANFSLRYVNFTARLVLADLRLSDYPKLSNFKLLTGAFELHSK